MPRDSQAPDEAEMQRAGVSAYLAHGEMVQGLWHFNAVRALSDLENCLQTLIR